MLTKNIDANDGIIKIRISTLDNIIIQVLLVAKCVHPLKYKIKECLQILGTGTRNEDIRVPMCERSGDGQTQRSGFPASTGSSKCYS